MIIVNSQNQALQSVSGAVDWTSASRAHPDNVHHHMSMNMKLPSSSQCKVLPLCVGCDPAVISFSIRF